MHRIYSVLFEIMAAAVFIIPIWVIYNKLFFHSVKSTIVYVVLDFIPVWCRLSYKKMPLTHLKSERYFSIRKIC